MKLFDLAIIGHIAIDRITLPSGYRFTSIGGPPTYAGFSARLLGASVVVISSVGYDFRDEYLMRFTRAAIPLKYIRRSTKPTTKFEIVYFEDWSRSLRLLSRCEVICSFPKNEVKAKAVLVAPICGEVDTCLLNEISRMSDVFKVIDVQGLVRRFDENGVVSISRWSLSYDLLSKFDVVKASREEAIMAFNCPHPIDAIRFLNRLGVRFPIVTLGGEGVMVGTANGKALYLPAYPVYLVDPTGCGDVFLGTFTMSYIKTSDVLHSLAVGVASASFVAEGIGPSNFGFRDEVEARAQWLLDRVKFIELD